MANFVLTLPDEAAQKLKVLPQQLRSKIVAAAKTKEQEGV